jgi:probable F420-dependent oxidoreductase
MNTDEDGIPPLDLARFVEDSGIESLFIPDHSHVPAGSGLKEEERGIYGGDPEEREKRFAGSPGGLPREYYHNYDQLTTIAAMGAVTSTLRLGSGICLVVQRDPFNLAKQVASLDYFTGGRFIFGVGAGAPHNALEHVDHGVNMKTRFSLMAERLNAMKRIWAEDMAEFHGKYVDFDPLFSWPKPVTSPHPPILMGGMGPTVLDRVMDHADGWFPGHTDDYFPQLKDLIPELRERAANAGKSMEITLNFGRREFIDQYVDLGLDRVVYLLSSNSTAEEAREFVREVGRIAEQVGQTSSPHSHV